MFRVLFDGRPKRTTVARVLFVMRMPQGVGDEQAGTGEPTKQAAVSAKELAPGHLRRMEGTTMLWTIFVILLVLWLLGYMGGFAFGGTIHLLLIIAAVVLIFQLLSGRRAV